MIKTKEFSLIELMIAAGLGLILMGVIAYTLNTSSKAVVNTQTQVNMHSRGKALMNIIKADMDNILAVPNISSIVITIDSTNGNGIYFQTTPATYDLDGETGDELNTTSAESGTIWVRYRERLSGTTYKLKRTYGESDTTTTSFSPDTVIDFNPPGTIYKFDFKIFADGTEIIGNTTYTPLTTWPKVIRIAFTVWSPDKKFSKTFSIESYIAQP
jgi:type II secretory pathway pseudopilin PulG